MIEVKQVIGEYGVIIPLRISVSYHREIALRARKRSIPQPKDIHALVDTGADCTIVHNEILLSGLGLPPKSWDTLYCLDSNGAEERVPMFDVGVSLVSAGATSTPITMKVAGKSLGGNLPYRALVGRDLLRLCKFSYDGPENAFTLTM